MTGLAAALAIVLPLAVLEEPAQAAAPAKWCWSMDNSSVRGTFTTTGTMPGDGTAAAATYDITDASVYASTYPDIESGSVADGTYTLGFQPTYQIVWDGSAVTGFWRSSGALTNGLGIYNGAGSSGAYLAFNIGFQQAKTDVYGTTLFSSSVTPSLAPVPSTGLCAGESVPSGRSSAGTSSPGDIIEQYGRTTADEECRPTYGPSYAMWMNAGLGGWVCTRTLTYSSTTGTYVAL